MPLLEPRTTQAYMSSTTDYYHVPQGSPSTTVAAAVSYRQTKAVLLLFLCPTSITLPIV